MEADTETYFPADVDIASHVRLRVADADDFVPPPPVVTKEAPKGQWDDEDQEEEAKEEAVKEVSVVPAVSMFDEPGRYL